MAYSTTKILVNTTADNEVYTEGKVKTLTFQYTEQEVNGWIQNQLPRNSVVSSLSVEAQFKNVKNSVTAAKSATASISVNNSSVWSQTIDADDTWYTGSGSRALSNSVVSSPVVFKIDGPEYTNLLGQTYHNALRIRQKKIIASYECPYFSVTVAGGGAGGTVSGGGSRDIKERNTDYSVSIKATPATNYHFVRWDFSGGASGNSTSSSYTFTYRDTSIGAHSKTITATAIFAPNLKVTVARYAKIGTNTDDSANIPVAFLNTTNDNDYAPQYYAPGNTVSRTAKTSLETDGRGRVYRFTGWEIYKGTTRSGTPAATSTNAKYSYTFNNTNISDANGNSLWVACYERLYFLEVTKPDSILTYTVKNLSNQTISSSGNGVSSLAARYAIPSNGCKITLTINNPRYIVDTAHTGISNSTYGTTSLSGTTLTVTPKAAESTAFVNLAYLQAYWQLTVSGNTGYAMNYTGMEQLASYNPSDQKVYVLTVDYDNTSFKYGNGSWMIPVDSTVHIRANTDTGYDATVEVDGTSLTGRSYSVQGANDHTVNVTQLTEKVYTIATSMVMDGDTVSGQTYGTFTRQSDGSIANLSFARRHDTVILQFTAGSGFIFSSMRAKPITGQYWTDYNNPCRLENVVVHMQVEATIVVDVENTYLLRLLPPRYGAVELLYNPSSGSPMFLNAAAGQGTPTEQPVVSGRNAEGYLKAFCTGNGLPYAFYSDIDRGSGKERYYIPVLSTVYSGGQTSWVDTRSFQLPVGITTDVTFGVLYRKNCIDIPLDETVSQGVTPRLIHRQPRMIDTFGGTGTQHKSVRYVYVDKGNGMPECVWECADPNPCGRVANVTLVSATDASSPANEKAANLFDGKYVSGNHTKWYAGVPQNGTPLNVVCDIGMMRAINAYTFVTANDTASHADRNPRAWRLLGSNDQITWSILHDVDNDTTLQAANYTPYTFYFDNVMPFRFYKLEILRTGADAATPGTSFQLSELLLGEDLTPLPNNGLR